MADVTTNFEDYIENLQNDNIETIYSLYYSVSGETNIGGFKTSKKGTQLVTISDYNTLILILKTDEAKEAFLNILDYKYGGGFGKVYGHYEFIRSMEKDD